MIADAAKGEPRYANSLRRALERGLVEPIERASELLVVATAEFTTSMTRIKAPAALETQHRTLLNAAARGQALTLERVAALAAGEVDRAVDCTAAARQVSLEFGAAADAVTSNEVVSR
jgi:hypothetical protein